MRWPFVLFRPLPRLAPYQAAQQKRLAEELARPRPRTCPSEEAINKAKAMACHRPAVAFGISYRGESGRDMSSSDAGYMSPPGRNTANAQPPPPPPSPGKQHYHLDPRQQQQQQKGNLLGSSGDQYKFHGELGGGERGREDSDMVPFGHTLGCREMVPQNRAPEDDSTSPLREHREGADDAPASRLPSSSWSAVNAVYGGDDRTLSEPTIVVTDDGGETTTGRLEEGEGRLVSSDGVQGRATKLPDGRGGASSDVSETRQMRNELVESWLLDVRLETETAGTALRVSATAVHACHLPRFGTRAQYLPPMHSSAQEERNPNDTNSGSICRILPPSDLRVASVAKTNARLVTTPPSFWTPRCF